MFSAACILPIEIADALPVSSFWLLSDICVSGVYLVHRKPVFFLCYVPFASITLYELHSEC